MVLVKLDDCMQKNANRCILVTLPKTQLKDLNIRTDTLNLTEKKVENSLELIGTGKDFLTTTLIAQALRTRINKQDLMNLKSFSMAKVIQTK